MNNYEIIEDLLYKIENLKENEHFNEILEILEKYTKIYPNNIELLNELIYTYFKLDFTKLSIDNVFSLS